MAKTATKFHERYMRHALSLACRAQGDTSPNPMVGAVIVKAGRIVGKGYHRRAGAPHAEIEALREAKNAARGATLYVTLEPCNHYGRTPPCCDAIIAAGIQHVVIATRDPNPVTFGRGVARLKHSKIRVTLGLLGWEARSLNAPFVKAMETGFPWVIAKIAQSLDGKIATRTGQSRWISSSSARRLVHEWRLRVDAILVGIHTILQDDPSLTARTPGHRRKDRPIRVIVDSSLRMPISARVLRARPYSPVLVATTNKLHEAKKRKALARRGAQVLEFQAKEGRVPLRALFQQLVERGIHSVLIEGGGELLASAFAERLVDRVMWFVAPLLIGGKSAPSAIGGQGIARLSHAPLLDELDVRRIGPDLCIEARVVYPTKRDSSLANRRSGLGARGSRTVVHRPSFVVRKP